MTDDTDPAALPPDPVRVALESAGVDSATADRWAPRLPATYTSVVSTTEMVDDVKLLAELDETTPSSGGAHVRFLDVGPEPGDGEEVTEVRQHPQSKFVVASALVERSPLELSKLVPILERLGFWVIDAQHWTIGRWWMHRVGLRLDGPGNPALDRLRWSEAAEAVLEGRSEADDLLGLVTAAGLSWQEVADLRLFVTHRLQVDHRYSLEDMAAVLVSAPGAASALVELFARRFDPDRQDLKRAEQLVSELFAICDGLERLDDDRMLRGLASTVAAVTRTNRWSHPDHPRAVKLDPAAVADLPAPRPAHETWVHGAVPGGGRVSGIHLRGGTVARGGIRWSDRPHDLRTEVLDLMRTQVLKNAPIIPTGAKGGFVSDGAPGPDAYDAYISALLDLTDDRRGDRVVPAPGRLDGDDTYLVVAADRGTASFSDRANRLATERGYWLGDAFASGGSHGYDHKALGVTARGAWEAVVHHFGRLGIDPRTEEITVVGIGDMSGDVFGNFALRSPHLKLIGAFDHRHVFCDPDPDPATTHRERVRMAALGRSSWDDYDRSLLSEGGFIVPRSQKQVPITPQVASVLRIQAEVLTPAELIRAVLTAPVDLLFAGGIGTFIRSGSEPESTVDDRANSELRVTAEDLRARVVGEGANLAVTQRGRIAYARRGGRINRDAIDNAAGVDTSDHEVNLKILLDLAVGDGTLSVEERNRVLADQTEAVVAHVLGRVRRQCERLTHSELLSGRRQAWFELVLLDLVKEGVLDHDVDVLPDRAQMEARRDAGAGLTRPELAVVLAGVKRWLAARVLESDIPDETASRRFLVGAFPADVSSRFDSVLDRHPLRRELIASGVVNGLVDRLGMTFVHRIAHDTATSPAEVVRASLVAEGMVGAEVWWGRMAEIRPGLLDDPDVPDAHQLVVDLCDQLTRAELLRASGRGDDIATRIASERPVAVEVAAALRRHASIDQRRGQTRRAQSLVKTGWSEDDAAALAVMADLGNVHDLASLSRELDRSPRDLVKGYATLDDGLGLGRLARTVSGLEFDDRWAQAAQAMVLDDLVRLGRDAVRTAVAAHRGLDAPGAIRQVLADRSVEVAEAVRFCREAEVDPGAGLAGLAVAVRALERAVITQP